MPETHADLKLDGSETQAGAYKTGTSPASRTEHAMARNKDQLRLFAFRGFTRTPSRVALKMFATFSTLQ